jgi:putative transposase
MADTVSMALAELVRKAEQNGDVDFLRDGVRVLSQALMEVEVSQHLGAERHERTAERSGQRNGYREREWDTRVGTIGLRVPRVRDGSYFPAMLEPRRRSEQAQGAVVREAYVQGVSTRQVDDLVKALGLDGISQSQVSRLCETLDEEVERFRGRPLEGSHPYVWLDATFVKARDDGRVVGTAVVIAIGVNGDGQREALGLDVGPSEDGACWLRFLRSLVAPVPAQPSGSGPQWGPVGAQRCAPGTQGRDPGGPRRRELAALPGPFPAQPAGAGPEVGH